MNRFYFCSLQLSDIGITKKKMYLAHLKILGIGQENNKSVHPECCHSSLVLMNIQILALPPQVPLVTSRGHWFVVMSNTFFIL